MTVTGTIAAVNPAPGEAEIGITGADIAAAAGVSKQTVSRVLNGSPHVRTATRDRVLAAMRDLGYRPNAAARSLSTGRTGVLGVVAFDMAGFGPATFVENIGRAAHDAGYDTAVLPLRSVDARSVAAAVDRMLGRLDGLITVAPDDGPARALRALPPDVPRVAMDDAPDPGCPVVGVDVADGAARATAHLLQLGHRTVVHLAGPRDSLASRARIDGWRRALAGAGAPVGEPIVAGWDAASGYGARLPDGATAVFAANDHVALGLVRALHEQGRRVPEDVSVIGFDDVPEAAYLGPPLTTVRPDFAGTARAAVAALIDRIAGIDPPPRTLTRPDLIVRASTAPPPDGG